MIYAIVESNNGTLVIDLPCSIYDLYEKLTSIGVQRSPKDILLTDGANEDIRVRLNADSKLEGHLLHVLDEHDSLQNTRRLISMDVDDILADSICI